MALQSKLPRRVASDETQAQEPEVPEPLRRSGAIYYQRRVTLSDGSKRRIKACGDSACDGTDQAAAEGARA